MDDMVASLLEMIPAFARGSYAILGSSMGAWAGFELAKRIVNSGLRLPEALIVCAASSPIDKVESYRFPDLRGAALAAEVKKIHPELAATPGSDELISAMLPVLEADFALCEYWQPDLSAKLPIPIFGFYGSNDQLALRRGMERWALFTSREFVLEEAVNGHHNFVDSPAPALFARLLELLSGLPGWRWPQRG
jgi:surfactin synthase thioesterase subunit